MKIKICVVKLLLMSLILCVKCKSHFVEQQEKEMCSATNNTNESFVKGRFKRYLQFYPTTKILFRCNVKDNVIIVNQIFAHAYGFRGNFDLLQPDFHGEFLKAAKMREDRMKEEMKAEKMKKEQMEMAKPDAEMMSHKISKRHVFSAFELMLDKQGFDGRACLLKTICEAAEKETSESGIMFKLFKRIFTLPKNMELTHPHLNSSDCEELKEHCPLSLRDLSPFTDGI